MPKQTDALANVYAKSLFELAQQEGGERTITAVLGELEQICELMRSDKSLREFFASPIIDMARRSASIQHMFSERVSDLVLRFLLVLNNKRRLNHLEAIAAAYDRMVHETFGRIEVDVYTAAPLANKDLETIEERIKQALGREPVLHPYTEPSMLGGLKLRIGDQLIDGSVVSKLRRMKRELMSSEVRVRERYSRFIDDGGRS
ncbi:MAG: ATP synthase F1 subunit delta [Phycisphaerales bacterium]|nr:ATP synthase F1 subunit delta [Phycisphaerales bacterium]MCI0629402.1 ATP synthase F1 subunit delta [Phycisphaerales bacterium]MCI0674634.1 ATP synthase F1 subunit delta [Phycisphaerales bacterium]